MKVAKIKNKYMYETSMEDNGSHYYLLYFDRKEKKYIAIQLTHLYIKDRERFKQVSKGNILVEKFKIFEVPSGVKRDFYESNIFGDNIDPNDKKNVVDIPLRHLSRKQVKRIFKFLKKKT